MLKTNDLSDRHAKKSWKVKKKLSDLVRLGLRFLSPTQGTSPYRQQNKNNSKNRENEDGIVLETESGFSKPLYYLSINTSSTLRSSV